MKTNTNETAGEKAMVWINNALAHGKTVYVCTMIRATAISPNTHRAWAKSGNTLFKLVDGDLYIASGRHFNKLTSGNVALVGFRAS
ncbi:MAG: hypothetical protein FJ187_07140 [Gammaproteobacteria bacterium]|nr:hypothetical protein [Gammaproteobacteria bacterium]